MVLVAEPVSGLSARDRDIVRAVIDDQETVRAVGRTHGLSGERIRQIVEEAGYSIKEVRELNRVPLTRNCGICNAEYPYGSYEQHCHRAGHRQLIPSGEKVERNQQMVDFYVKDGYNTSEIAEYFAVPQPVVTRQLHRADVFPSGRRRRKGLIREGA